GLEVSRQGEAGQVAGVGVALVDLPGQLGVAGPHGAVVVAGQKGGDGRSPRSGSEYRDPHAGPPLLSLRVKGFNHRTSGRPMASPGRRVAWRSWTTAPRPGTDGAPRTGRNGRSSGCSSSSSAQARRSA